MDPKLTAELRAALARSGLRQIAVARVMGYKASRFSKILKNERPMPEGFAAAFTDALKQVGDAEAKRIREQAELEARRVLAAVGATETAA